MFHSTSAPNATRSFWTSIARATNRFSVAQKVVLACKSGLCVCACVRVCSTQSKTSQHQSTPVNTNQHQSTPIKTNQRQSTPSNTSQHQSRLNNASQHQATPVNTSQHPSTLVNTSQHQSTSVNKAEQPRQDSQVELATPTLQGVCMALCCGCRQRDLDKVP